MPLSKVQRQQAIRSSSQEGGGRRTGLCEHVLGRAESIGLGNADRKPDETEEEVEHHECDGELEDERVEPWGEIIDHDGAEQHQLGYTPDQDAPLDAIVRSTSAGEIDVPNDELRDDIVCGRLTEEALSETSARRERRRGKRPAWQLEAVKDVQAVQAHQATTKPTRRAYRGPALSAAQM